MTRRATGGLDNAPPARVSGQPGGWPDEPLECEFSYRGRQVAYRITMVSGRPIGELRIDGVLLPLIRRLTQGDRSDWRTHILPFQGFRTMEVLARALIDVESELWRLSRHGARPLGR